MSDNVVRLPLAVPPPHRTLIRRPAHYLRPESLPLDHNRTIAFFHPGYCLSNAHDPVVEILRLPAYDNAGLHHGTALAALSIIAHNKSGYLTTDGPSGARIISDWDAILPSDKNYYYHLDVPPADPHYPVCATFTDWALSPSTIPSQWRSAFSIPVSFTPVVTRSHMSSGVRQRDISCRITASIDATENAHIIPRAESLWFLRNGMHIYNFSLRDPSPSAIDDVQNGILMRRDVHFMFDQKVFCFVVKAGALVSHYLKRTNEMAGVYHNAEMRMPGAAPPVEFFWVRFAWSLFPHVGAFEERLRLVGRVPVEEDNDNDLEAEADVTPKSRKRGENTPRGSKRKRGGRGRGGVGRDGIHNTTFTAAWRTRTGSALSARHPRDVSPRQLARERERDRALREHFFPQMKDEKSWSEDATWQFANWYPGIEHMERVKRWWRVGNPQVGEEVGDAACDGGGME